MSEARINRISNEKGDGGPSLSGITTFSGLNYFVPPKGTTAERPSDCPPGSIRFNTDSAHLEYFSGLQWLEFEATNEELGGSLTGDATTFSTNGMGHRGVIMGKDSSNNEMEFLTISTLGWTQDFGTLTRTNAVSNAGFGSRTRGFAAGGGSPEVATTDTFVFASTANATSFGDITQARRNGAAVSNTTRGVLLGGWGPNSDPNGYVTTIDYCTMASTGTWVDFGDTLFELEFIGQSAASSSVRGVWGGGATSTPALATRVNTIQYVTISTTGNSLDFGDLQTAKAQIGAVGSSTRAVFAGGSDPGVNGEIDFITIASTGNGQDFGDLATARRCSGSPTSPTRGVFAGGYAPTATRNIEYVTIATTGNGQEFGELTNEARERPGSCSNGHGGL